MATVPSGVIFPDLGSHGSYPSGFTRHTNLDNRYPVGSPAATNPNVTGGASTHTHATSSHTHSLDSHTHSGATTAAGSGSTTIGSGAGGYATETHTHTAPTTGAQSGTSGSTAPNTATGSSLPSSYAVIFIESDGSPVGVANNRWAFWGTTSAPSGWAGEAGPAGVYIVGANTATNAGGTSGGTHTHSGSSHNHTMPTHSHTSAATGTTGNTTTGATGATAKADDAHTHTVTVSTTPSADFGNTTAGASGATSTDPPYYKLGIIKNTSGGDSLPSGIIGMWVGTLASIPSGWSLCDGTNGTPDLRDKFIVGALANLSDVGGTGGATTHGHTAPSTHTHSQAHTHSSSFGASSGTQNSANFTPATVSTTDHTHANANTGAASDTTSGNASANTITDATTEYPPYRTVAFIQYTVTTSTRTITPAKANIQTTETRTITPAKANITETNTRTITPVAANIQETLTRTITPVAANIQTTETRTISSVLANIEAGTRQISPVAANIQVTETRTVTPTAANLQVTETRTITPVAANVQVTNTNTISSVAANVDVTGSRSVPATANLQVTETRTITPVRSNISQTNTQTISSAAANISQTNTRTISSVLAGVVVTPSISTDDPIPTAAQVEDALSGRRGPVSLRFRYTRRTRTNVLIDDISEAVILPGAITLDNSRPVVRDLDITFLRSLAPDDFDASADIVGIAVEVFIAELNIWTSIQVGLFLLETSESHYRGSNEIIPAHGADMATYLVRSVRTAPYTVTAGTNYVDAVEEIVARHGLNYSIPDTNYALPYDVTWLPGSTDYDITRDLLFGINYYPLWADSTGTIRSRERIDPAEETTAVTYRDTAEPRMISALDDYITGIDRKPINRAVVTIDNPSHPSFGYVQRENADEDSPNSTKALAYGDEITITSSSIDNPTTITAASAHGFATGVQLLISEHSGSTPTINGSFIPTVTSTTTLTIPISVTVAGTGGTLQATTVQLAEWKGNTKPSTKAMANTTTAGEAAEFELRLASAMAQGSRLPTFMDPRREAHEFYTLDIDGIEDSQQYAVFGWNLKLAPGSIMQHAIGKALSIDILSPPTA